MKCNSSKVQDQKYKNEKAKAEAERKAMLDAMTEEERAAFLEKEKEEREANTRRAQKHLANLAVLSATIGGPYGTGKF